MARKIDIPPGAALFGAVWCSQVVGVHVSDES